MRQIILDLLEYSKICKNDNLEKVNLNSIIKEIKNFITTHAFKNGGRHQHPMEWWRRNSRQESTEESGERQEDTCEECLHWHGPRL